MPTFAWNRSTNVVSSALTDQSTAQYQSARGGSDLRLIITEGGISEVTEVQLDAATPSGYVVGFILRDPDNLDTTGELSTPTILTRGASAADGYIGTTSTDTDPMRQLMGLGVPGGNQTTFRASAVFYYVPVAGGNPVESQPFDWIVTPAYYQPGTPPASITAIWDTPAQLNAAIAAAAAAQPKLPAPTANGQFLFGNTDGSVHFGAFPTGLSLSLAALTVSATATFGDQVSVFALGITDSTAGIDESGNITGDGAAITNLTPANLSGPVPIVKGGTGGATAAASLTNLGAEAVTNKGAANGYAPLDGSQKVPSANLPSYVDDVLEFANVAALPSPGETGKIYVALDTNFEYRWSGSTYIRIVSSPGTTDDLAEGATNLYYTDARALAATDSAYLKPTGSGAGLTNVAPYHPVSYVSPPVGPSGNGTTIAYGANTSAWNPSGTTTARISDVSGTIRFQTTGNISHGDVVATITFHNSYGLQTALNNAAIPIVVQSALAGSVPATGQTAVFAAFAGVMASNGNTMQIVCGASDTETTAHVSIPSGENFVVSYFLAVS